MCVAEKNKTKKNSLNKNLTETNIISSRYCRGWNPRPSDHEYGTLSLSHVSALAIDIRCS